MAQRPGTAHLMHFLRATSTFGEPLMPLTIVIADDVPEYRLIVQTLLRSMDIVTVVGEAADGEEALALVRRERPDLLITDLVMPHLNGIELTRRVREESPQTLIILMSSYTEDAYRLMASDSGADAFINKKVLTSSLVMVVHDVVRRRTSGGGGSLPPSIGGSSASVVP
jgi:two-component system response regulator NreC